MIDRLEKAGRMVLWFALALVVLLYPVQSFLKEREAARAAEQAKAEAARLRAEAAKEEKALLAEKTKAPERLTLASMGPFITSRDGSIGYVWFSNASARAGVMCIYADL